MIVPYDAIAVNADRLKKYYTEWPMTSSIFPSRFVPLELNGRWSNFGVSPAKINWATSEMAIRLRDISGDGVAT